MQGVVGFYSAKEAQGKLGITAGQFHYLVRKVGIQRVILPGRTYGVYAESEVNRHSKVMPATQAGKGRTSPLADERRALLAALPPQIHISFTLYAFAPERQTYGTHSGSRWKQASSTSSIWAKSRQWITPVSVDDAAILIGVAARREGKNSEPSSRSYRPCSSQARAVNMRSGQPCSGQDVP